MNSHDSFCTLVPLRGGSKGIPGKNIKNLAGKPLCYWAIKASLEAGLKTAISTNDEDIKAVVESISNKVIIIDRPDHLASDLSSTESVIEHALSYIDCENLILMQATSPLTAPEDLYNAIKMYEDNRQIPLLTATRSHRFFWDSNGNALNYDPVERPRRQDWDGVFQENGAFYIFSREFFIETGHRCAKKSSIYVMEDHHALEIDSILDWEIMEVLAARFLPKYIER